TLTSGAFGGVASDEVRRALEEILPGYLAARRWFGSTGRTIESARIVEAFPLGAGAARVEIAIVRIDYAEGDVERYALPLALAEGALEAELRARTPQAILVHLSREGATPALLFDALAAPATARTVLDGLPA